MNEKAALGFYVMAARAGVRGAESDAERLKRKLQAANAAQPPPAQRSPFEPD